MSKKEEENEMNIRVFNINQRKMDKRSSDPRDINRESKCDADKRSKNLTH